MSLLEIKCPMCKGTLWLDPSSGRVVDHKPAAEQQAKVTLSDFMKSQKNRGSELEDKFKKAKEESDKRKEQLDQEFKHAKENPEALQGDADSIFKWD